MKIVNLTILLSITFISALSNALTFDTVKFKSKAVAELERAIGKGNLKRDGKIFFRDGAGSTDHPPLYDFSAFIYIVSAKPGLLPDDDLKLGYRLLLNGKESIVFLKPIKKYKEIIVSASDEGIATLLENPAPADIQGLIEQLTQISPQSDFQYLEAIGILAFTSTPILNYTPIFEHLKASKIVMAVDLSNETYRTPYKFEPTIPVRDSGKIDADKYRTYTRDLKLQGAPFASETTIPKDLQ